MSGQPCAKQFATHDTLTLGGIVFVSMHLKRLHVILGLGAASLSLFALQACSGDNNSGSDAGDASNTNDVQTKDVVNDVAPKDSGGDVTDSGPTTCPLTWTAVPDAGEATSALTPEGGLPPTVLLHAFGTGTQNYACLANDAGVYSWNLVTPAANLEDCNQVVIGHHFASDAGVLATRPEWQTTADNAYVIAKKVGAYDAGSASIPWLLLQETSNSGADSGTIANTLYVQRINTSGGWPTATCDSNNNADGGTTTAAYTADYYFYGN